MTPFKLPMATSDCGLDERALQEQLGRYRQLGAAASGVRRSELELSVQFAAPPDPELLRTTIDVERECCSFFTLDYDEPGRRFSVSVVDSSRRSALDAIQRALNA